MQRLKDDRGAVAVMVALLMVPLIGFAAIAVDVSAMYAQRQQLQTGADAGALAVAKNCAQGACGTPSAMVQTMSAGNLNTGTSSATVAALTSSKVTVHNSSVRQNLFAPILGIDQNTIRAAATAVWGSPSSGTAVLPLAFSWCEFQQQTGGGVPSGTIEDTIFLSKSSSNVPVDCTNQSNNLTPGGFGWLRTDGTTTCQSTSAIGGNVPVSTGNSVPSGCSAAYLKTLLNQTILLPLFDAETGTGNNATYQVYGYAAFRLTGYNFGGQYKEPNPAPCSGSERCVRGYFVQYVDLSGAFNYGGGAPNLGSTAVSLTE
jgi:Flp pilus assembly protein TadG